MSRHIIRNDSQYEVVVGWDPSVSSFFAQVLNHRAAEDPTAMVLWVGREPYAIGDLPRLQREIADYALIDSSTRERLMTDRALGR